MKFAIILFQISAVLIFSSLSESQEMDCDERGVQKGTVIMGEKCSCKFNVIGDRCEQCKPGTFGLSSENEFGCTECFCMDVSKNCESLNQYRIKIRIDEAESLKNFSLVPYNNLVDSQPPVKVYLKKVEDNHVIVGSGDFLPQPYYWILPQILTGNLLKSYGGNLYYTIRFISNGEKYKQIEAADVILISQYGHEFSFYYYENLKPNEAQSRKVPLLEEYWRNVDGIQITRNDFLMALTNIESIKIRAIWPYPTILSGIHSIALDTAAEQFKGKKKATEVEQCICPIGYTGISCEECSVGYKRIPGGTYLGICVLYDQNGYSDGYDPIPEQYQKAPKIRVESQKQTVFPGAVATLTCIVDHRDNDGDSLEYEKRSLDSQINFNWTRADGSQLPRDSTISGGILTIPHVEEDAAGVYICQGLDQDGNEFERVESSLEIASLPPSTLPSEPNCDPRGIETGTAGVGDQCTCKEDVIGDRCEKCIPGTFGLSSNNEFGCIECYCLDRSKSCTSLNQWRIKIPFNETELITKLSLVRYDLEDSTPIKTSLKTDGSIQEISGSEFPPSELYYWTIPSDYLGNLLKSYGGKLYYTIRFSSVLEKYIITKVPDIILMSDYADYSYTHRQFPPLNKSQSYGVVLLEEFWRDDEGERITRDDFLVALTNVTAIQIRAIYATITSMSAIRSIALDSAANIGGQEQAIEVEHCSCPTGYTGLSCEECDIGWRRQGSFLLDNCVPCVCSKYFQRCDSGDEKCQDLVNLRVENEEQTVRAGDVAILECSVDHYDDHGALLEKRILSSLSLLHLDWIRADNSELPRGSTVSGGILKIPHFGEDAAGVYICRGFDEDGNEFLSVNSSLKISSLSPIILPPELNCDERGILRETVVGDEQCFCKSSVTGDRCEECKQGTFGLSSEYEFGCIECHCMGKTSDCTSLNQSRVKIPFNETELITKLSLVRYDLEDSTPIKTSLKTDGSIQEIFGSEFPPSELYYWTIPSDYLGNLLKSYGGKLYYTIRFSSVLEKYIMTKVPDIILMSDYADYSYTHRQFPPLNKSRSYGVVLLEEFWRDDEGERITRDDFLVALTNVTAIQIRAIYATITSMSAIRSIALDSAANIGGQEQAIEVENCSCPTGYTGLSCEECAIGYTRLPVGYFLDGNCLPSNCPKSFQLYDSRTGECEALLNMRVEPEKQTVPAGAVATLTCIVDQRGDDGDSLEYGKPSLDSQIHLNWTRADGSQLPPNSTVSNGTLTISNVEKDAAGVYICQGFDNDGDEFMKANSSLRIVSLPTIRISPGNQTVELNAAASFACEATGDQPIKIEWTAFERNLLPTEQDDGEGVLTFHEIAEANIGKYVCTATNEAGSVVAAAEVACNPQPSN